MYREWQPKDASEDTPLPYSHDKGTGFYLLIYVAILAILSFSLKARNYFSLPYPNRDFIATPAPQILIAANHRDVFNE